MSLYDHDSRLPEPSWLNGPPEYDPPPQPRCSHCGAFLAWKVDRQTYEEDILECDGTATHEDVPYDDRTIEIIGEEYRGKTYHVMMSPCGSDGGEHQPHDEVVWATTTYYRTCKRCGSETADVQ